MTPVKMLIAALLFPVLILAALAAATAATVNWLRTGHVRDTYHG
jgi:hypothetical protein